MSLLLESKYRSETFALRHYFSEDGRNMAAINAALQYLKILLEELNIDIDMSNVPEVSSVDMRRFIDYELGSNSKMKAIEKFLIDHINSYVNDFNCDNLINFGITEEDLNSLSFASNFKSGTMAVTATVIDLLSCFSKLSEKCEGIKIISRKSNGSANAPIHFNKVLDTYTLHLSKIVVDELGKSTDINVMFGGDGGTFMTHKLLMPKINWENFADKVVDSMDLIRDRLSMGKCFMVSVTKVLSILSRVLIILQDYLENILNYVKDGYLVEEEYYNEYDCEKKHRVIKPFDIETIIGLVHIVNSQLENLNRNLPRSRYQGDHMRNIMFDSVGDVYTKLMIIFNNTIDEINKLEPNKEFISDDLSSYPESVLRTIEGYLKLYAKMDNADILVENYLKKMNYNATLEDIAEFIEGLQIKPSDKEFLLKLDQFNILKV